MIKILHPLLCYYPSQAGGPANAIYWLNNSLKSNEYQYIVVSTKFGILKKSKNLENNRNKQVTFIDSVGISFLKHCLKHIKNIDIIQFSSLFFIPTLPILLLAIHKKKSIIISPRGELYEAAISQKTFKKKLWITILKVFQNKIHFHASNDFELNLIQKVFSKAKSTIVIPNYIEMPKKQRADIKISFIFLGRINPIKNIHLLISALAKTIKKHPQLQLDIVGSARLPYELEYQKKLQELTRNLNIVSNVNF